MTRVWCHKCTVQLNVETPAILANVERLCCPDCKRPFWCGDTQGNRIRMCVLPENADMWSENEPAKHRKRVLV